MNEETDRRRWWCSVGVNLALHLPPLRFVIVAPLEHIYKINEALRVDFDLRSSVGALRLRCATLFSFFWNPSSINLFTAGAYGTQPAPISPLTIAASYLSRSAKPISPPFDGGCTRRVGGKTLSNSLRWTWFFFRGHTGGVVYRQPWPRRCVRSRWLASTASYPSLGSARCARC